MKKILTLIWVLIITSSVYALDAPHNDTNTMSCYDCHDFISQPTDDICLSCHINASGGGYSKTNAPKAITHSSANTSTKYGVWETKCRDCHRVHFQEQFQIYGSAAYLGTGTITSVTDNGNGTTTFGYSDFVEQRPGWSDFLKWGKKTANERGLILLPNLGNLAVNFEIFSAATNTITVTGSINSSFPGMVSIGNTFALIYGQNIRANAITPSGLLKSVSFFDKTGNKSFAYNDQLAGDIDGDGNPDDMIPDGICQVCHTNTEHFRSNGILAGIGLHNGLSGSDCSVCHKHTEGFSGAGACKSCHGFPPVDNALGGPDGLAQNEGGTGSTSPGAHAKHATSSGLNYPCGACHTGGMPASAIYDKIIQFGFNALDVYKTGNYDGRATPANGYSYSSGDPGTIVTNTGTKTCGNIYCHGSTMASNGGTDTTPVWDDPSTGACGTCHGATAANPPSKAAHEKHTKLFTNRGHEYACTLCHNLSAPQHVNNKSEIMFSTSDRKTAGGSYSGTDTMLDAYGDCSNIYCHSNVQTSPPGGALTYKSPNWGDLPFEACDGCHEGPSEHFSMPVSGNTTGSHVKHAGYGSFPCYTCHASDPSQEGCQTCHTTAGTWPYNTHADYTVNVSFINAYGGIYSGTPEPGDAYGDCTNTYCHSSGKGTYTTPAWGSGALGCNGCHGIGNTLGRPDYANAGAGAPNANSHEKHALSSSDCKTCHKDTTLTGTTINLSSVHVNKNLNVNFDASIAGAGATWTAGTKTCSNVLCHGSNTPQWGASNTNTDCTWCHGGNAISTMPIALPSHPEHMNNAAVLGTNYECAECHSTTVSSGNDRLITGTVHANGTKNVSMLMGGTWTAGTQSCTSVYCHSSGKGTYANPPVWGSTTDLGCNRCHGTTTTTGAPDYANAGAGQPNANSHGKHVGSSADCAKCHTETTLTGTSIKIGSMLHTNQAINVVFDTAKAGAGATWTASNKTCSNISCHAPGIPQWGGAVSCGDCHAVPPATGAHMLHTASAGASYGSDANNSMALIYNFNCGNCHPMSLSSHGNGTVDIELYNASATGFKAKNPASASRSGAGSATVCDGIYCHSDGTENPVYKSTPSWGGTFSGDRCAGCHGNSPATNAHAKHSVGIHYKNIYDKASGGLIAQAGNIGSGAAHGDPGTSTTISCNICHNSTVKVSRNDNNPVCNTCHSGQGNMIASSNLTKSFHINGARDVAFIDATIVMRSKAQLRDDITQVPVLDSNWTRQNGYKAVSSSHDSAKNTLAGTAAYANGSCSSVSCHNNVPVAWTDKDVSCDSCHTALP